MTNEKKLTVIVEHFNSGTLPKSDWTHSAHLIVALWHIKNYGLSDAICQLRSKIILLNRFHETPNNGHSGYHETLTIFWTKVIDAYIKNHQSYSFEETVTHFLNSSFASKELPFEFYKKEDILSSNYRAIYHDPTLKKLNG